MVSRKSGLKRIMSTLSLMTLSLCSAAQDVKPLSVGDSVPDIEFDLVNSKTTKAKLSDYAGKWIILDFWATTCRGCIEQFPKIDSLQREFKDKLAVILINSINSGDTRNEVLQFFELWKTKKGKSYPLPSAVEESLSLKLFPCREVPHQVWISPGRKVMAITSGKNFTRPNIQKAVSTGGITLDLKKDFFSNMVSYRGIDFPMDDLTYYSVFKKGKLNGVAISHTVRQAETNRGRIAQGIAMNNLSLLAMYRETLYQFNDVFGSDKRTILEVTDSSALLFDRAKSDKESWENENLYTYELIVPLAEADSLYQFVLRDLNKYSGYYGKVERRKVKCLVLIRTSADDKIKTQGGKALFGINEFKKGKQIIKNLPVSRFIRGLNAVRVITLPVIDETNYPGNIDIEFLADYDDMAALRKALQQYDLDLLEAERDIDMFVLTETRRQQQNNIYHSALNHEKK